MHPKYVEGNNSIAINDLARNISCDLATRVTWLLWTSDGDNSDDSSKGPRPEKEKIRTEAIVDKGKREDVEEQIGRVVSCFCVFVFCVLCFVFGVFLPVGRREREKKSKWRNGLVGQLLVVLWEVPAVDMQRTFAQISQSGPR